MKQYNRYNIRETDSFNAIDFPKVEEELDGIIAASKGHPSPAKADMLVSYLKNHSLEKAWMDDNTELTDLLTAGHFATSHTKALFECCRENKLFLKNFEEYVRQRLEEAN